MYRNASFVIRKNIHEDNIKTDFKSVIFKCVSCVNLFDCMSCAVVNRVVVIRNITSG